MRFKLGIKWRWNARGPAMAAGAIFLTLLVMFPHLPLPWFRASEQIAYDTSRAEYPMPGTDTDGDGLYDNLEKRMGTDPDRWDTDSDTLNDGQEYRYWVTRADKEQTSNTTANWLVDKYPKEGRPDLLKRYGPSGDLEGDRLSNIRDPDSDGDTLLDGIELDRGTDPANPDTDGDGIPDNLDNENIRPGDPQPPTNNTNRTEEQHPISGNLSAEEQNPQNFSDIREGDKQVLFYVFPASNPRYWRLSAYDTYRNGSWLLVSPERMAYAGQVLPQEIERPPLVPESEYQIVFNNESTGFLPNALHTTRLFGMAPQVVVTVDRMYNFLSPVMVNSYNFSTFAIQLTPAMLETGQFSPDKVHSELCAVPDDLPSRVKALALTIGTGRETPAAKIKAILGHLKSNYRFSAEPSPVPPGEDMVDRFLFKTRQGSSLEFSSAFVTLCRYNGIPCRFVTGFALGDLSGGRRAVRSGHFHAWAEVLFSNLGWVQFETSNAELAGPGSEVGAEGNDTTVVEVNVEKNAFETGASGGGTTNNGTQNVSLVNRSAEIRFKFEVSPSTIRKGSIFEVFGTILPSFPLVGDASVSVFMDDAASVVGRGRTSPNGTFTILCNADGLAVGKKLVGLNMSIQDLNSRFWAVTNLSAMKEVELCSNVTLEIIGKGYVVQGNDYCYTVRLRDAGGMASPWQEAVNISWNGSLIGMVEAAEREEADRFPVRDPAGPYNLTADFPGSRYLYAAGCNRTVWVKSEGLRLSMKWFPERPVTGNPVFVEPVLLDEQGRAVYENVTLSFDNGPVGTNLSGSIMKVGLDRTVVGFGLHRLSCRYAGSDMYPETVAEYALWVIGLSEIALEPGSVSLGSTGNLTGSLRDNLRDPIPGVFVTVRWLDTRGNETSQTPMVIGDGYFTYRLFTSKETPPGGILVNATFPGDNNYTCSTNTTYIQLTSSSVFAAQAPRDLTRGAAFTINGSLSDHLRRPIAMSRLSLQRGGSLWGVGWTDVQGRFSLVAEVPSSEDLGETRIELSYAGEGYQEPASSVFNVTIYTMVFLNLSVPGNLEQGGEFEVTAQLVDDRDGPVSRENITVRFDGKSYTRMTDVYGRASFWLRYPWFSTREDLQVVYKGGQYLRPASARVSLAGEPVMLYRLLGILAAAALFAMAYYIYRRLGWGRRPEELLMEMLDKSWISDKYRKTIFKVYTRMLGQMRDRGHAKRDAWTVHEYEAWLQRRLALDLRSLRLLTLIFEEARYSAHRLDGTVSRKAVVNYRKLIDSVTLPEPDYSAVPVEIRNAG